jgi:hypothetical protein
MNLSGEKLMMEFAASRLTKPPSGVAQEFLRVS